MFGDAELKASFAEPSDPQFCLIPNAVFFVEDVRDCKAATGRVRSRPPADSLETEALVGDLLTLLQTRHLTGAGAPPRLARTTTKELLPSRHSASLQAELCPCKTG